METIAQALQQVMRRIALANAAAGRPAGAVAQRRRAGDWGRPKEVSGLPLLRVLH